MQLNWKWIKWDEMRTKQKRETENKTQKQFEYNKLRIVQKVHRKTSEQQLLFSFRITKSK